MEKHRSPQVDDATVLCRATTRETLIIIDHTGGKITVLHIKIQPARTLGRDDFYGMEWNG